MAVHLCSGVSSHGDPRGETRADVPMKDKFDSQFALTDPVSLQGPLIE
jgi:hypothetical protein